LALAGVAIVTYTAHVVVVNATTVGFALLLLVLIIASTFGFVEAALASGAATLAFNYYFLPPLRTLSSPTAELGRASSASWRHRSFGSRLSEKAKRRALDCDRAGPGHRTFVQLQPGNPLDRR
jgi:two-component system sensor histidine kinase KdpD